MLSFDDIDKLKALAKLAPEVHLIAERIRLERKAAEIAALEAKIARKSKRKAVVMEAV